MQMKKEGLKLSLFVEMWLSIKKKKPRKLQKGLLEPISEFIRSQMNTQKPTVCLGTSNDHMRHFSSVQSLSRVQLCNPMNHSTPGFTVIVQRGSDQLVDLLLMSWWWVSIISLQVQPLWGLHAWGWHTIMDFSKMEGVSVCAKQFKDITVCIPWCGNRTLLQGCSWLFLPCLKSPAFSS